MTNTSPIRPSWHALAQRQNAVDQTQCFPRLLLDLGQPPFEQASLGVIVHERERPVVGLTGFCRASESPEQLAALLRGDSDSRREGADR